MRMNLPILRIRIWESRIVCIPIKYQVPSWDVWRGKNATVAGAKAKTPGKQLALSASYKCNNEMFLSWLDKASKIKS